MPNWSLVHQFWFPDHLAESDAAAHARMFAWWFNGGSNAELAPFVPLLAAAQSGRLEAWGATPRGRLSLILLLDQFTRGLHPGSAAAYANDAHALCLAEEMLAGGQYDALEHVWERTFVLVPLVHAEGPSHLPRALRALAMAEALTEQAPAHLRPVYAASAARCGEHVEVIRRFGRFPHRNARLGRASSPAELRHLERGAAMETLPQLVA